MWAFVRVKDPGSGLPKFVLINWVSTPSLAGFDQPLFSRLHTVVVSQLGEGVPEGKKGTFPSQSAAVAKFLKG